MEHTFADAFPELVAPAHAEEQPDPQLVVLNEPLARELGFDPDRLRSDEGIRFLTGRGEHRTVAMAYAGHQFGQFAPRLGDGRALLLGEIDGRDLHAKGTGPTPFSRGGDGRGALGPMLREYLVSEAMHALGVPTTRALAVISTGRRIMRTGTVPGAILVRTAASHLRVGTVQYARITDTGDLTERLCTYARERHYPGLDTHDEFFSAVMDAQIATVAQWMRLGFIHGVMNTDNTTLSGETIDYGPCAFLDHYDPATHFSSIDTHGRYAFRNQPAVLGWNLARLAEAMVPLIEIESARDLMTSFPTRWEAAQTAELSRALGTDDTGIHERWTRMLEDHSPDLTDTHRLLNDDPAALPGGDWSGLAPMEHPFHIPRNQLLDAALRTAEAGDLAPFRELLDVVTDPFTDHGPQFRGPAPEEFNEMFRTFCGT